MQHSVNHFLITDRLVLRPLKQMDGQRLTDLLQVREISQMTETIPFPYTLENAEEFISERRNPGAFGPSDALAIECENALVGVVGIHPNTRDSKDSEPLLGFWLGKDFWGRGFMTEAAGAIIHVHFAHRNVRRIRSRVLAVNGASLKIHQKLGFRHVETKPDGKGGHDARHFSLDPEDFGFDAGWHGLRYLWQTD